MLAALVAALATARAASESGSVFTTSTNVSVARLAQFADSRARCKHGDAGLIISLRKGASRSAYRSALATYALTAKREADLIHGEYSHINAIAMKECHPDTLLAIARHLDTVAIEASCKVKRTLPRAMSISGASDLFTGRYTAPTPMGLNQHCEHAIEVAVPYRTTSPAKVTIMAPEGNFATDCTDGGNSTTTTDARVSMARAHEGSITLTQPNGVKLIGKYQVDANGRLSDTIEWSDGGTWIKSPGPSYDKTSDIGPLDDGHGTRRRNMAAQVRWNWGLDRIDKANSTLDNRYDYGHATGNGTTLYNLDTGVAVGHDDFGGRAVGGYSTGCPTGVEWNCRNGWAYKGVIDDDILEAVPDCSEHGTHTSSTAAGSLYGVAPEARVVAVQVLPCDGSGSDLDVMDGILWAREHAVAHGQPSVLSLSLGGDGRAWYLDSTVKHTVEAGVLVVVAAGNEERDACRGSPAGEPSALTVGASDLVEMNETRPGFLATDPWSVSDRAALFSDTGSCVDLFAPGVEILAAVPVKGSSHYTAIMSGTSMATPLVAGVALQIWGLHPQLTPDDVTRAILCLSIDDALFGLDPHTPNRLLQGGAQITQQRMASIIDAQSGGVDATRCYVPRNVRERRSSSSSRAAQSHAAQIQALQGSAAPGVAASAVLAQRHAPAQSHVPQGQYKPPTSLPGEGEGVAMTPGSQNQYKPPTSVPGSDSPETMTPGSQNQYKPPTSVPGEGVDSGAGGATAMHPGSLHRHATKPPSSDSPGSEPMTPDEKARRAALLKKIADRRAKVGRNKERRPRGRRGRRLPGAALQPEP
jgi:hypothetical protein